MPNRIFLATLAFIIELYSRVDSSKKIQMNLILAPRTCTTPARSHFISGLTSRVLKLTFFCLKIMVKSGPKLYFEIHRAPSELLLPSAKKSAH